MNKAVPDAVAFQGGDIRHDWTREEVEALFALPFNDLLFRAQTVHRAVFDPNTVLDQATYLDGTIPSLGIPYVLIGGEVVVDEGEVTAARPGRAVRAPTR